MEVRLVTAASRGFFFLSRVGHDRGFAAHNRSLATKKKNPLAPRVSKHENRKKKKKKKKDFTNKQANSKLNCEINKQSKKQQAALCPYLFLFFFVFQGNSSLCAYLYGVRKRDPRSNTVQLASRESCNNEIAIARAV